MQIAKARDFLRRVLVLLITSVVFQICYFCGRGAFVLAKGAIMALGLYADNFEIHMERILFVIL